MDSLKRVFCWLIMGALILILLSYLNGAKAQERISVFTFKGACVYVWRDQLAAVPRIQGAGLGTMSCE